jgi:hypothetical protein
MTPRSTSLLWLLAALSSAPAFADVAVLSPAKDNTLIESATGALSNGLGGGFNAGRTGQPVGSSIRRGVIAFGLGTIPAGSTITSARLDLHAAMVSAGPARAVALHRLLVDWGEGTSNAGIPGSAGAPATTGDATWLHRFFPITFWTSAGGDFSPLVSATQIIGAVGFFSWGTTVDMVSDVQSWLDAPGTNFGWLLQGDESIGGTAVRFDTREATDPSLRPTLTVEYTPPVTAAQRTSWGRLKSLFR